MPLRPLTNFEIQNFYQNEPKINGVCSRNDLSKIKDGTFVINLGEYESIENHWIALFANDNKLTYFDSFGVEHIAKEIRNKYIITNIFRIQVFDSILCEYFCIGFIDFMLKGKTLSEYTNIFSPNDYEKINKIILK